MRLAIYDDQVYRVGDGAIWAERAFPLFLAQLADHTEKLVLIGRLDPRVGRWNYRLPTSLELVGLPYYSALFRPREVLGGVLQSAWRFWRMLDRVDAVWLLGPHPLGLLFAALAAVRRKPIALGVRQDLRRYARSRHPGRRVRHHVADVLEGCWRLLGRRCAVVAVGPDLASRYARADRLLQVRVSLVRENEIAGEDVERARSYDGELRVLSVGRLDAEKNPLLMADTLAALREDGREWRLIVCGEGPLAGELERRLRELGAEGSAELRGYVPVDAGLMELYRSAHLLLHVSWTEGLPGILFEAFASRLPVVATAVGGIAEATGDEAAVLIPPGDTRSAVEAVRRVVDDEELRTRMIRAGLERVRAGTIEAEGRRVAEFLRGERCR